MKLFRSILSLPVLNLVFFAFLISLPIQTRIIYNPSSAYINWYFSYPLAYLLYSSDILLITLLVAGIWFHKADVSHKVKPHFAPIILLIIWVIISLFHVKQLSIGIYQAFKWIELTSLVILVPLTFRSIKDYAISAWIIFISGVGQALLVIWQFHVQHSLGLGLLGEYVPDPLVSGSATISLNGTKLLRAYGTFPHPNVLGAFLCVSIVFGLWLVSRATDKKQRILLGIGLCISLLGVFVSFSRVSWFLAALICLIYIGYYLKTHNPKNAFLILFIGLVSCGTIIGIWHNLLISRVSSFPSSNSLADRGTFNHYGIEIIKQNPMLGTGIGNYIPAMEKMFHVQPWQYQPAHNVFIYLTASLGIIGLALFLWLLWIVFCSIWNNRTDCSLRLTLLILGGSLIFMSLFDHFLVTIQQGQLLFFTSIGLMAAFKDLKE